MRLSALGFVLAAQPPLRGEGVRRHSRLRGAPDRGAERPQAVQLLRRAGGVMHPEHDIDASDWTEQDLLTRDLAAQRLAADEAETAAELQRARATPDSDPAAVELLERRLRALEATRANLVPGWQNPNPT